MGIQQSEHYKHPGLSSTDSDPRARCCGRLLPIAVLLSGCATVGPGQVGVLWKANGGTQSRIYGEGKHAVASWNKMYVYDLKVASQDEALSVLSADGLAMVLNTTVRYRPLPQEVLDLHGQIGQDYYKKIVLPVLQSEVKRVASKYSPEEIYATRREQVERESRTGVAARLQGTHVAVEAVLVRNVVLPPTIQKVIDQKVATGQEVLRMQYVLQVTRATAEQRRIEAQSVADYNRTLSPSLSPAMLEYERTQQLKALSTSPNAKTVVIGPGGHNAPVLVGAPAAR